MSSSEILIACCPLALYFSVIGMLHFRRHPTLWNGIQDVLFLCFGMSGLVFVGPVKLLCPIGSFTFWGFNVFLMLLILYGLLSVLFAQKTGLKTVLYHITGEDFGQLCEELVQAKQLETAGNTYKVLHNGVQFQVEHGPFSRTIVLRPTSIGQNIEDWFVWERMLKKSLPNRQSPRSVWGFVFCSLSALLLITGFIL